MMNFCSLICTHPLFILTPPGKIFTTIWQRCFCSQLFYVFDLNRSTQSCCMIYPHSIATSMRAKYKLVSFPLCQEKMFNHFTTWEQFSGLLDLSLSRINSKPNSYFLALNCVTTFYHYFP